ncbi:probable mitochondrial-processing peptidase subunit beta, mitochondrial [Macadamia integrifolia]|uniref:probable mitochondrial-processing peptidase subunit beta, mitochondrial n=1 Tax=Macadamia integrifolia TaxID=60698 RepID=UPI001C4F9E89|nr:probable mitochondrial-processing peptidase subunit beta, mitochondrial [Macadamia integrifolia]XP_042478807.1 probable mitochondrial-processing peptidase subunit beta, mitochondrial [Macadamia integrifolia]
MASTSSSIVARRIKILVSSFRPSSCSLSTLPTPLEENPSGHEESRFLTHNSPDAKVFDHSAILRFPEVQISTLPNGIRVATQRSVSNNHTASVGVWIDTGSRFEAPGTNGTAHFLEHMVFKGTRRRSSAAIEQEIENMGGHLNAYTSREQTTFYANVLRDDVPVAIDILADMLQNSKFGEHAIKRERGVILREMEEVQRQTQEVLFDHLHWAAFRNNPLGNTILGPPENIRTISGDDLCQYISTHYTGPRMVVSAAGAVKHDRIVDQVSRFFKRIPYDPTTAPQLIDKNPAIFTGSEVRVVNNDMPVAHVVIAFKGAAWADPSSIPLMMLQCLLGSWDKNVGVSNYSGSGSEFIRRISKNELAESVMAFNTNYHDTGLFGIYSTAKPECLHDLSIAIMQEFCRLAYKVSEAEVVRAQNQLKSSLLLHIDGTSAIAENNGRQILTYGRVIPYSELFARIDGVDASTIKEMAEEFIINKDAAIAAIGPIHQLPDYNWFCSQTRIK